jgi:ribonuclease Z
MSFSLTVLGSSSALPTSKRFTTAQVLNVHERFFLIDCGEGTQIQLRRFSINFLKINHIFISHLHGDHIFGLFGLMSSYNLLNRKSDLHIYAHGDLEISLEHYKRHFGSGLLYSIVLHPFTTNKSGMIYSDRHMTVETLPLRHSIPAVGFIFREKEKPLNIKKEAIARYQLGIGDIRKIKQGNDYIASDGTQVPNEKLTLPKLRSRSYAFCTDTTVFPRLVEKLKDIDMLYFEATFANKDKKLAKLTGHTTAPQAAQLARDANVGKLLIGHFSTRYKSVTPLVLEARAIFENTYAVEDGDNYPVELQRNAASGDLPRSGA